MKKILLFVMLFFIMFLLIAASSPAQETLLGKGTTFGGFGGPVWKTTTLNGDLAFLGGARGGLIINHTFIVGYGEYSLANNIDAPGAARTAFNRPDLRMDIRYRGLEFEYVNNWEKLFHWGVQTLVGGGSVNYHNPGDDFDTDDTVFVLEPALNGTINIAKWFRAGVNGSYRFVADVDMAGLNSSKLSGPALSLELRFGKF